MQCPLQLYQKSALRCTQFPRWFLFSFNVCCEVFFYFADFSHPLLCESLHGATITLQKTSSPTPNSNRKIMWLVALMWNSIPQWRSDGLNPRMPPTSVDSNLLWMLFIFYLHFDCQRCAVLISFDFWVKYN